MSDPNIVQAAIDTLPNDWAYTPVAGKKPLTTEWQKHPFSKDSVIQEIKQSRWTGIGALCGVPSGGVLFLDHDGESCDPLIEKLSEQSLADALPHTVTFTSGRVGRYQAVYRIPSEFRDGIATCKIKTGVEDLDGKEEQLEFRWNGCQSVVCGIHPDTKQPYRWINSPVDTPIADAPVWMIEQMLQDKPTPTPTPTPKPSQAPYLGMDEIPLIKCLAPKHRDLIASGMSEGGRDDAGIALAMDLVGTEQRLRNIGQRFDGDARSLFEDYCSRCNPPLAGNDVDRIWKSAEKSTKGPCLSEDKIQGCIDAYFKREKSQNAKSSKARGKSRTSEVPDNDDRSPLVHYNVKGEPVALKAQSEIADILAEKWKAKIAFNINTQTFYAYGPTSDGLWVEEPDILIQKRIQDELRSAVIGHGASLVNSVLKLLAGCLVVRKWVEPSDRIPLRNGVLNPKTGELAPHAPEYRFTWQLPYDYNPAATCGPIIEWLAQTQYGDQQRVQLLRAYLRACVMGAAGLQRFLELLGAGGSGKSTYANLAIALIGSQNCYVTSISELETNRFATAALYGKRLVSITDADGYNKTLSKFKSLTGQDVLPFERKNKDARDGFVFGGMVIYVANKPLASSDNTSGLERRRLTCPFDKQIPLGEQRELLDFTNGEMKGEFVEHLPGLLNWVLGMPDSEMFNLVKNTAASVPSLALAKIDVLLNSNSLAGWLDDCCIFAPNGRTQIGTATRQQVSRELGGNRFTKSEYQNEDVWLYANYRAYCDRTGHIKAVTMRKFSDELIDLCRNQLKNPDVKKEVGRNGAAMLGIILRAESDQDSPTPISGGGRKITTPTAAPTPEEVWASVPEEEQVAVKAIVELAWDFNKTTDTDAKDLTKSWTANCSRSVRSHSLRYLQSHGEMGSAIIDRITKIAPEFAHVA